MNKLLIQESIMELLLKIPPVQEPITLEEVRSYLRISTEQEDDVLFTLIKAARCHVESLTGRALLKQQWQMSLKPPYPLSSPLVRRLEKSLVIHLPRPPLLRVESVMVKDEEIPFTQEGSKILLSPLFWEKELRISYWAGYGETGASLPPDLKMAVLMAIRMTYDHQPVDVPLLKSFKVYHL